MAQAAASPCKICTGGRGEHYCQQCGQLFCVSCKLYHLCAMSCKNHTFVSGRDINQEEAVLCTEHNERLLFYCQDCDTSVCRICSVEKHSRHLITDLTKSTVQLRSELSKNIDTKITTTKLSLNKIEKETKAYREEVEAVIKTITDEGNYWKNLIDKKVEALIKLVRVKEQKRIQNILTYKEVYKEAVENCQTMQKNIKTMETTTDFLLLKKLKQLKTDVDQIVLKQIPDAPIVSYRHKKPSDTEIDKLFGELQIRDSEAIIEKTDKGKGHQCTELLGKT